MEFNFKDKVAVVTGGASGLGKCIATEFAKAGANVIVIDRNSEKADQTAQELHNMGVKSMSSDIDITNYQEVERVMEMVNTNFGRIDILINCAGICILEPILDMELKNLDAVIDIDLKGTVYCTKAALKYMKEQKYGKIVNMSSIAAKLSGENASIYSCVKNAIISFTASIGREFARDGINCNAVLPGIIRTNMWEEILDGFTNKSEDKTVRDNVFNDYEESIPNGKAQEPIDIANMTLFLCTEEARYITSQNIGVDGGQTF